MNSIHQLAATSRDPQAQMILKAIAEEFDRFDRLIGQLQSDVASLAEGGRASRSVLRRHEADALRRVYRAHACDPKFEAQLEACLASPE